MKRRITQYIAITLILTAAAGSIFYFRSIGATQINSSQETKLTDGLVGYWTFDGNHMDWSAANEALDQSGNGNDGDTISMTNSSSSMGNIGQALTLDGSADYVYDDPIDQTGNFTISFWAKANVLGQNEYTGLFSSENPIDNNSFQIDIGGGETGCTNQYGFFIWDSAGIGQDRICMGTYTTDWQFLTVTWDGTTVSGYLDGVFQNSAAPSYNGNIDEYIIGANRGLSYFFNGKLDEVRVYTRALTTSEIAELYNQGQSKINSSQEMKLTDGLVGYWSFDGNHMDWSVTGAEVRD